MCLLVLGTSTLAQSLGAGARPVGQNWSRSPVFAQNGLAATAHPLASQIAIDVLKAGGSAVDAAIAANAALGLMEPTGNGIGGDLFAIVWDPKANRLFGYNGSGRSSSSQTLSELSERIDALKREGKLDPDFQGIPSHGSLPVTVPGTVDGWFSLHERWGTLPMGSVLAPAIRYAKEGFPMTPVIAQGFAANLKRFRERAPMIEELDNAMALYFPTGDAPAPGDVFRNADLAETLSVLAEEGRDSFYSGSLGKRLAAYFAEIGAPLTASDLAAHRGEWVEPRGADYHGVTLWELPPNGQGFAALMMLNILKQTDVREYERGSVMLFHLLVEAKRLAFEAMAQTFADPDFADIPLDYLLSADFAAIQYARIDAKQVLDPAALAPMLEGEGDGPTINLDKVSHKITELRWDGSNVIGKASILNTPMGNIVSGLLEGGVKLGVSSRGMGSLVQRNGTQHVAKDFMLSTVDIVQDPSAPEAFVNGIMEGVDWVWNNGVLVAQEIESIETEIKEARNMASADVEMRAFKNFLSKLNSKL